MPQHSVIRRTASRVVADNRGRLAVKEDVAEEGMVAVEGSRAQENRSEDIRGLHKVTVLVGDHRSADRMDHLGCTCRRHVRDLASCSKSALDQFRPREVHVEDLRECSKPCGGYAETAPSVHPSPSKTPPPLETPDNANLRAVTSALRVLRLFLTQMSATDVFVRSLAAHFDLGDCVV